MKKLKLLLIILFFISFPYLGWATNYYIDSAITDTYPASATPDFTTYNPVTFETTGGSASVYKTIADVNLKAFAAGDFVYFRKGQTWYEQLIIPSSGSAGNPITFGAYGSGGKPAIDGGFARNNGINNGSKYYVTIDGLEIKNTITDGISVGSWSQYNTIQNCTIHDTRENGIGIYGTSQDNIGTIVRDNEIYNFGLLPSVSGKGQGIMISGTGVAARVENALVENNYIHDGGADSHDHGVYEQGYQTTVRYNNFANITGFGIKVTNDQSGGENGGGNQSYYNIITGCIDGGILVESGTSGPVNNKIWNNVIYNCGATGTKIGGLRYTIGTGTLTGNEFKNNIVLITHGTPNDCLFVSANTGTTGLILSNNIYYSANSQLWYHNGNYTGLLSTWQGYAGDANSLTSNPLFISASDFHLQLGSPAINAGVNWGQTRDYNGINKQGSAWDIGALEYFTGKSIASGDGSQTLTLVGGGKSLSW